MERGRQETTLKEDILRESGFGQLGSVHDYLQSDPVTYHYYKLKDKGNKYLNDKFWTAASQRGGSDELINLLYATEDERFSSEDFDKIMEYENFVDLDTYLLALQIPHTDNTVVTPRYDESGKYHYGDFTDREWYKHIIDNQIAKWDAHIIEVDKNRRSWFASAGVHLTSAGVNVTAGAFNFFADIYNLGESLFNLGINAGEDDDMGSRFLYAYANDDKNVFSKMADWLKSASFEFQRKYAFTVDAELAHEQGYTFNKNEHWLNAVDNAANAGAGYTTWGRWTNAMTESIGYMLPTIILAKLTGGASASAAGAGMAKLAKAFEIVGKSRSLIFYSGIFSGMIKDSVAQGDYKELGKDAGMIVLNSALKAAAQFAVEKALDGIMGSTLTNRLMGTAGSHTTKRAVGASLAEGIAGGSSRAALKVAGRMAKDALQEGLEETLQEATDIIIDTAFNHTGAYKNDVLDNDPIKDFDIMTLVDAFVVGAMSSIVMGSLRNTKIIASKHRGIGIDENMVTHKLGLFQSINYHDAMSTLQDWYDTLQDPKAKLDKKAAASFNLQSAMAILGDIYQNMGVERAQKADAFLQEALEHKSKDEIVKKFTEKSDVEYASKLYEDFMANTKLARIIYDARGKETIKDKIKNALNKEARKLKKRNVTEITSVTTTAETVETEAEVKTETKAKSVNEMSKMDKVRHLLKKLNADVILGVNGQVVSRSDEIVFVDEALLTKGDIETILKGLSADLAIKSIKPALTEAQKKMILNSYKEIMSSKYNLNDDYTLDDALTAFLFDKRFYLHSLFLSHEPAGKKKHRFRPEAMNILATIDQIMFQQMNIKYADNIDAMAMMELLRKVRDNMRDGIVTFATQYAYLDIDSISDDILPRDLKDIIRDNENYKITQVVESVIAGPEALPADITPEKADEILKRLRAIETAEAVETTDNTETSPNASIKPEAWPYAPNKSVINADIRQTYYDYMVREYDKRIESFHRYLERSDIDKLKEMARSSDANDRLDAVLTLEALSINAIMRTQIDKASVLPLAHDSLDMEYQWIKTSILDVIEQEILNGVSIRDFLVGRFNVADMRKNSMAIKNHGYSNYLHSDLHRLAFIRKIVYSLSDGKYTIGSNGMVLKVLDRNTMLKPEYRDGNTKNKGDYKLYNILTKHDNKLTVGDIIDSSIKLPEFLKRTKIVYKNSFEQPHYDINTNRIVITNKTDTKNLIYDIMHELTHATQTYVTYIGKNIDLEQHSDLASIAYPGLNKFGNLDIRHSAFEVAGASDKYIRMMIDDMNVLTDHLETYFPMTLKMYNKMYNHRKSSSSANDAYFTSFVTYMLLDGELQARASSNFFLQSTIGFTIDFVNRRLISPIVVKNKNTGAYENITIPFDDHVFSFFNRRLPKGMQTNKKDKADIDVDTKSKKNTRKVPHKRAKDSNLKYWIKPGYTPQVNERVQDFVRATTPDALFAKLPTDLKNIIYAGELDLWVFSRFVKSAKSMNEFTFQAIAKYIYHNPVMADMNMGEMKKFINDITELAVLARIANDVDKNKVLTHKEMMDLYKEYMENVDEKTYREAMDYATTYVGYGPDGRYTVPDITPNPKQMNILFFSHFDGTLASLEDINKIGKSNTFKQTPQPIMFNDKGEEIMQKSGTKTWNYIDKAIEAEIDYLSEQESREVMLNVSMDEKADMLKDYIEKKHVERWRAQYTEQELRDNPTELKRLMQKMNKALNVVDILLDRTTSKDTAVAEKASGEINKAYLSIMDEIMTDQKIDTEFLTGKLPDVKPQRDRVTTNFKSRVRTLITRLKGSKWAYNSLPEEIKKYVEYKGPKTFELNDEYKKLTEAELRRLSDIISIESMRFAEHFNMARARNKAHQEQEAEWKAEIEKRITDLEKRVKTESHRVADDATEGAKTEGAKYRKGDTKYKTKVVNQTFEFESAKKPTEVINRILDTQWGKRRVSEVKNVENIEQNVHSGTEFYKYNRDTLLSMTLDEAAESAEWFMDKYTNMLNNTDAEYQTFRAVRMYFLGYVLSQSDGGVLQGLDPDLRKRIESFLRASVTASSTELAIWKNIIVQLNPLDVMKAESMTIDGMLLTDVEKDELFDSIRSGDINRIAETQKWLIDRKIAQKEAKYQARMKAAKTPLGKLAAKMEYNDVLRRITSFRSMMMLSSPLTWLRNQTSNIVLKHSYKLADKIGAKIMPKSTVASQLRMDVEPSQRIKDYIQANFIDNGLFDKIIDRLTKYNPNDIPSKFKQEDGKVSAEHLFANMVIKATYNQYYHENTFKSKHLNTLHRKLMKVLSDNKYVRDAAINYFGKILAERRRNLDDTSVTRDDVMMDFAKALGLAMADYMHQRNFVNDIEAMIAEKSETGLFLYKLVMPYASAGWNWFKAAMRFSPIGLAQSIYKLTTLEKQIITAERKWALGKGNQQIAPELTEFMIRRNIGSGIIGTMLWGFGALLAGLGFVDLEDEDYGIPKLRIGNVRVNIRDIFGSSSVLAGMAFVKTIMRKDDFWTVMNATAEPLVDGFFLAQILDLDRYNRGGFASWGKNFFDQTVLSFIPNGLKWIAGATYTGTYQTDTLYEKAVARIPFLGMATGLQKKVNPYTGDEGDMWDIFNRVLPYLEVRRVSMIEKDAKDMGINKTQLRGKYEINGEKFELSAKDTAELNKTYGEWNAYALTLFYNDQVKYKVRMPDGNYRHLYHGQMSREQVKNVVQNITADNARYAKISAWLRDGNSYYASAEEYKELRKRGIKGKLYKGNKRFVKG